MTNPSPRSKIRPNPNQLKPSDLGVYVTVCIAAACEEYSDRIPKIVLASDKMLSVGVTSMDTLKARGFGNNWGVMFAGDDVTFVEEVLSHATEKAIALGMDVSYPTATETLVKSYQHVRRTQLEQLYLATYAWGMETFLKLGPDVPTVAHREYLLTEMDRFDLGCQFLVSGFRSPTATRADIFEVHNPGRLVPQSITGYAAIGTGSTAAISYLARREQSGDMDCAETVYNVVAAKRLAEKALGVGPETAVFILERSKAMPRWLTPEEIDAITDMWVKEESQTRPRNFKERVSELLAPPAQPQIPPPEPEK